MSEKDTLPPKIVLLKIIFNLDILDNEKFACSEKVQFLKIIAE